VNGRADRVRSYRDRHLSGSAASEYEWLYRPGSFDSWLWQREKQVLDALLRRCFPDLRSVRYLDFACGTGRVAAYLEDRVAEAWGVDVSEAMIRRAQERLRRTKLRCLDLTTSHGLPGPFDLITAFRFFLNAEPELRDAALHALRERLSPTGVLIASMHGNAWSLRAPMATVRRWLLGQRTVTQMSPRTFRALLERNGFEVVGWAGVGAVPGKVWTWLGEPLSDFLSAALERGSRTQLLCVVQVAAVRPAVRSR
jgi:SAM-dependent methyltransferase